MQGDEGVVLDQIRFRASEERLRVTQHAHEEMVADGIGLDDVLQTIRNAEIIEDYPEHRRGFCCLLNGVTEKGRPLHIVCTTARPVLVLITVYEPKPPRWVTPAQRGRKP